MVVLQNCMDVVEGETGNCSGAGVTCGGDGAVDVTIKVEDAIDIKAEVCIKVEETIDIKDESLEATSFQPIRTEQEVRLWCVCVCVCDGGCSYF